MLLRKGGHILGRLQFEKIRYMFQGEAIAAPSRTKRLQPHQLTTHQNAIAAPFNSLSGIFSQKFLEVLEIVAPQLCNQKGIGWNSLFRIATPGATFSCCWGQNVFVEQDEFKPLPELVSVHPLRILGFFLLERKISGHGRCVNQAVTANLWKNGGNRYSFSGSKNRAKLHLERITNFGSQ